MNESERPNLPPGASCPRCGGAAHGEGEPCPGPSAARTLLLGIEPPALAPAPPATGPDPMVGTRVGSFQIVRPLGRGGMGTVYLAEHPVIGSKVAIKFLHDPGDGQAVARFYDEARAVNLIGHENIVAVYDLSLIPPDRYYFVMEYLDGETLGARLRRGPVPPDVATDVLLQLCDALQCAHERGVIHRDLKPDNVFLVPRRGKAHFVKLVDFGIAKLRGGASPTHPNVIVGTPEYIAPEQCDDAPVDARTDVYALGVIAFQLATGRLPFQGRGVTQLLLAHLQQPPPRPSSFAPVHPALEEAILTALEKLPAARFQDMEAFAAALRAAEGARLAAGSGAAAAPLPDAAAPATPAAPAVPAPTPTPVPPLAAIQAELTVPGGAPRPLPVVELTRGGLFLGAEHDLPPLFSRVKIALRHPALRAPLALDAEVVRQVKPEDAARLRMAPGLALQLVELPPEARAALVALSDAVAGPAPARPPPDPSRADARLEGLLARVGDGPYALLGVAPDAEFIEIRRAGRALLEELEALRARPLAADHPARATAVLGRIEAALAAVGAPAPRLAHDARTGNWRGVGRCLAAGVPAALVEARRRELLAAEPRRAEEAQRQLARAQVARKLGNAEAARGAFEAALAADPLDPAAREELAAFQRVGRS